VYIETPPIALLLLLGVQPEYSILALHLGSGGCSKYWLYWCPSQYVSAIKLRVLGVLALL